MIKMWPSGEVPDRARYRAFDARYSLWTGTWRLPASGLFVCKWFDLFMLQYLAMTFSSGPWGQTLWGCGLEREGILRHFIHGLNESESPLE